MNILYKVEIPELTMVDGGRKVRKAQRIGYAGVDILCKVETHHVTLLYKRAWEHEIYKINKRFFVQRGTNITKKIGGGHSQ